MYSNIKVIAMDLDGTLTQPLAIFCDKKRSG